MRILHDQVNLGLMKFYLSSFCSRMGVDRQSIKRNTGARFAFDLYYHGFRLADLYVIVSQLHTRLSIYLRLSCAT